MPESQSGGSPMWPFNRNYEAARRHVDEVLSNHGRWPGARRETQVAELLDELVRERDELRAAVGGAHAGDRYCDFGLIGYEQLRREHPDLAEPK